MTSGSLHAAPAPLPLRWREPEPVKPLAKFLPVMRVAAAADRLEYDPQRGSFRAWLAHDSNHIIAGGAVIITPWPSHPYDLECRRAAILNVYTDPEYRRRGIARTLLQTIIAWCQREGFARVTLHASDDGRHLYEALGFEPGNEMRLKLR